jgi:hypothetical protein
VESDADGERHGRRKVPAESGESGERRRSASRTYSSEDVQQERCAGGVMLGRRGGRRSHFAIRPIEQFVSSTVVMNRLQHIQVSQTSAVVKTDNAMT